jgi:hypothetical protein
VRVFENYQIQQFSHFLIDFHEIKLAIKFHDPEYIYLQLWITQKEPETIERTDFDGIVPKRQLLLHPKILSCIHPFLMDFLQIKLIYVFYDLENMYLPS